jgi:ferredoxin
MSAELHIDWTACDGRGLCTELLSGLLARDDWGYPVALRPQSAGRSGIPIPAADVEAALEAVALCPKQALTLADRAR